MQKGPRRSKRKSASPSDRPSRKDRPTTGSNATSVMWRSCGTGKAFSPHREGNDSTPILPLAWGRIGSYWHKPGMACGRQSSELKNL